jgi:hypothetical protein
MLLHVNPTMLNKISKIKNIILTFGDFKRLLSPVSGLRQHLESQVFWISKFTAGVKMHTSIEATRPLHEHD